jgi:uncharacterized RDD family membrane protein YckC
MAHALDQHAEKAYAELPTDRHKKICEKIFKALTDKGTDPRGIRRPTSLATLALVVGATPADLPTVLAEVAEVIEVFRKPSRSFLMPPVPEKLEPDTVIDISHESLMRVWDRLRNWSAAEAQSAAIYYRLADTARLHAAGKAGLWRDPDLQVALDWQQNERPTSAWADFYGGQFEFASDFLAQSKAAHDREKAEIEFERRWKSTWGLGILITVLVAFLYKFEGHAKALAESLSKAQGGLVNTGISHLLTMGKAGLIVTPYLVVYLLAIFFGKHLYRRVEFPRILKACGAQTAAVLPARQRRTGVAAVTALNTSYATFGRRFFAYLIDLGIYLVEFFIGVLLSMAAQAKGTSDNQAVVIAYAILFAMDCLYQALTISSPWQATVGMRAAGIIVSDEEGNPISFTRAIVRQVSKVASYFSIIGFFLFFFSDRKQTLHDIIARTVVLRRPQQPVQPAAQAGSGAASAQAAA